VSITKAALLQTYIIIHPAIPVYIVLIRKKKFSNIYGNRTRNETNIMLQLPLEYNGGDNKKKKNK